jgi:dienelactone hydrolase
MFRRLPIEHLPKRRVKRYKLIALLFIILPFCLGNTTLPTAIGVDSKLNEQVIMLPIQSGSNAVELQTTIFRPPGDGPFPVLIMNHGKARGNPHKQERERFLFLSKEFVKRGYAVVVPMRTGFAHSSGEYMDDGCNFSLNGQNQADDVQGVVDYLLKQPWVDTSRLLLAGQSYGGMTALALASRSIPGIRGLINFAGGLRTDSGPCRWKDALISAFNDYGSTSHVPSLWFYGVNDSYFNPALANALHDAYTHAGGVAKLVAFGPFKQDAHALSGSRDGVHIWWPETERFLKQIGMPTEVVVDLGVELRLPKTDYAAIDNVDAIPYIQKQGREQYKIFLEKPTPRAFAVSTSGGWSWAEDGDDPVARVLATCQHSSGQPCKVYAIDNDVVWGSAQ